MDYVDFHTHHPSREGELALVDGVNSWGIHPWHAASMLEQLISEAKDSSNNVSEDILLSRIINKVKNLGVQFIGECGLDHCCQTPADAQLEAFCLCVKVSEQLQLPLVLHCVRAADEVIAIRKELGARQSWIWHGFRGKPIQLQQLIPMGFLFSFGPKHNAEAVATCPMDRLLIETDDDQRPVREVYEQIASERDIPIEVLQQAVAENVSKLINLE